MACPKTASAEVSRMLKQATIGIAMTAPRATGPSRPRLREPDVK